MKFFKKLKAYKEEEVKDAIFGLGVIKAKDYDSGKFGHLILFSLNIRSILFLKKVFIAL